MLMIWVLHGQAGPPLAWTGPPPCFYNFSARWFAMPFSDTLHHATASALVFGGNIFTHPCFLTFYGMQISDGQWLVYLKGFQTTVATKESMCPECMAGLGCVTHCGMWLGGQPRVRCCGLAVIRLGRQNGGGGGGVAPQKLLASENRGEQKGLVL